MTISLRTLAVWLCLGFMSSLAAAQSGTLTRAPELIEAPAANYPESALTEELEGSVDVALTITEEGEVRDLEVLDATELIFVEPAIEAISQFRFTPAEIDGVPAAIRIEYRYNFRIEDVMVRISTATLDGCVVDAEGEPRPGVMVRSPDRFEVETGPDGCFLITDIEPGLVEMMFDHPDFPVMAVMEELDEGMTLTALYELDEFEVDDPFADEDDEEDDFVLVIRAPSVRREALAVEVRAEEARRMAGTQGDVLRVVEQMAGVGRAAAGSGALVVWGASPEDTRVYVDGVPLPRLYHTGGYRTVLPGSFVRQVSLIPGAYAATHGRGLGALILVEFDDPFESEEAWSGRVSADFFDVEVSAEAPLHEDVRVGLAARVGHLHRLVDAATGLDAIADDAPVLVPSYTDTAARVVARPNPTDRLELRVLVSFDEAERAVREPDPARDIVERSVLDFGRLSVHWTSIMPDGTALSIVPAVGVDRQRQVDSLGSVRTSVESEVLILSLRAGLRQEFGVHTVEAGLDFELEQAEIARTGSIGAPPREGDARVFGQPPPDQIAADSWQVSQLGAAPYILSTLRTAERQWELDLGLRVDPYYQSVSRRFPAEGATPPIGLARQDFSLEPRASLLHRPIDALDWRVSAGQFRQFAQAEDTSAVFGTPGLPVARGRHLVLAVNTRLSDDVSVETAAFVRSVDRLAVRNPLDAPPRAEALTSSGEGRSRGAQGLVRLEREILTVTASYTLSRSERRADATRDWRLFDQDQPHVLNTSAGVDLPRGWYLSGRYTLASGVPRTSVQGRYFDDVRDAWQPVFGTTNDIRLPTTHQLDARVEKSWDLRMGQLSLWLDIQNAINRRNVEELLYAADFTDRTELLGLPVLPSLGVRYEWGR